MRDKVSIIGAGLAGLALALILEKHGSVDVEVFEMRKDEEGHIVGGAVTLSPNGLRVLDQIGVVERIKDKGFSFEEIDLRDDKYGLEARYYLGQKKEYGYAALRIYRQIIIDTMKDLLKARKTPMHFGETFSKIVTDSHDGIVFETTSGTKHTTSVLIGADGIHSTVRKHLSPIVPDYQGMVAITSAIDSSYIAAPSGVESFQMPVTIMGKRGAFTMAPQVPDGSELQVGTQFKFEELDHAGWRALSSDRPRIVKLLTEGKEEWPPVVQDALDGVTGNKTNVWPFYLLPKLQDWASKTGRVVLIGDAAHAFPPSAGQGLNQAMEDAYALGLLMDHVNKPGITTDKALHFWQEMRQSRVDQVLQLNARMDEMRLPEAERKKLVMGTEFEDRDSVAGGQGQLAWLYKPDLEGRVNAWAASITD